MGGFIKVDRREYNCGGYRFYETLLNVNDISRIMECSDDINYSSIIMTDGKKIVVGERVDDIYEKITEATS